MQINVVDNNVRGTFIQFCNLYLKKNIRIVCISAKSKLDYLL